MFSRSSRIASRRPRRTRAPPWSAATASCSSTTAPGRLIEAQEFEHLTFDRWRFSPELLAELASATLSVTIDEKRVHSTTSTSSGA
jgi:hypothetical protein